MSEPTPGPEAHHHHHEAIEELEGEIKKLEGESHFSKPVRIVALVVFLIAIVAGAAWWLNSPPPITSGHSSYATSTGSPIDVFEPKSGTLSEPPGRFAWDSVAGRLQYVVRIYVKGASNPVLERRLTMATLELSPDERARMPRGNTFVWTVTAQGKDGSTIGAGQGTFKVR